MKSILHRPMTASGTYTVTDKAGNLIYRIVCARDALQLEDAAGSLCYVLKPSSPVAFSHPCFEVRGRAGQLGCIREISARPLSLQADFCPLGVRHCLGGRGALEWAGQTAGAITASWAHPKRVVIEVKESSNQPVAVLLTLAMDLLRRQERVMVS